MKYYNLSREDYIHILYSKYFKMEENKLWCLGTWESNFDYLLCEWDSDLLPKLVKKDEIRYEYNQYKYSWSYLSCTIFAAVGMISDLFNYKFSYDEIKEIDELSYTRGRVRWQWWFVQSAVKLVADWRNERMNRKVAFYRIAKTNDNVVEDALDKLYTLDWNFCPTGEYNEDKRDWMLDWTEFWKQTNGHSVCVVKKSWQRSIKDSGSVSYYWVKNKISQISNYWPSLYIYIPVDDNLEEVKRLNEMKTLTLRMIEDNSTMRHLSNDAAYRTKLHDMNERHRSKLKDIEIELRKYQ